MGVITDVGIGGILWCSQRFYAAHCFLLSSSPQASALYMQVPSFTRGVASARTVGITSQPPQV